MTPLPKARPGLLRHALDDQVLVYDSENDKVHLLDPVTASVLEQIEAENRDESSVRAMLAGSFGIDAQSEALPLAIDELQEAGLVLQSSATPRLGEVSRRQLIGRLATAGAAAFLIPAIVTITASTAAGASAAAGSVGGPCTVATTNGCNLGNRCCAGSCVFGLGSSGQCCTTNADCGAGSNGNCLGNFTCHA